MYASHYVLSTYLNTLGIAKKLEKGGVTLQDAVVLTVS
jgi:hypothetical protein